MKLKLNTRVGAAAASAFFLTAPLAMAAPQDTATDASETDAAESLNVTVHEGDFATIQQFTTPGGISVWLVEEPSIPIMSVRLAWEQGEATDPEDLEGLTGAMTYMMNEGAGDMDSLAFATRMEELNMSFSCGSGNENTYCSANMLTDNAAEAMDLVALALNEPRFDTGPIERFKREQLISIKTRETNARYLANRAQNQALMPDHPFSRETSEASISAITPELIAGRKDQVMTKGGLYVTAVGAMSPEELAPLLDDALADLPSETSLEPVSDVDLKAPLAEPVVVDLPQPQSLVTFTTPAMPRDDADYFPAYVLNYTFGGGGFESRLMKDLRVEKGLTYGVYTGISTGDHLNTWRGGGQTKNESAGAFIEGVKTNMLNIVEEGVTAEELSDAKAYLTGSYPLSFDSNSKIASNLMGVRLEDLGVDYFDRRNALVQAVTLEDANRVAAEYLKPENFSFFVVGQPQGLDDSAEASTDEESMEEAGEAASAEATDSE